VNPHDGRHLGSERRDPASPIPHPPRTPSAAKARCRLGRSVGMGFPNFGGDMSAQSVFRQTSHLHRKEEVVGKCKEPAGRWPGRLAGVAELQPPPWCRIGGGRVVLMQDWGGRVGHCPPRAASNDTRLTPILSGVPHIHRSREGGRVTGLAFPIPMTGAGILR